MRLSPNRVAICGYKARARGHTCALPPRFACNVNTYCTVPLNFLSACINCKYMRKHIFIHSLLSGDLSGADMQKAIDGVFQRHVAPQ